MIKIVSVLFAAIFLLGFHLFAFASGSREYLTEEEITLIQIKQRIDPRVKAYLKAAALRLRSAEARLRGEETEPGDPMEYFTPEDMLDGYYRILNSVMLNLEDANEKPRPDSDGIRKALKELRKRAEKFLPQLELLQKIAEEREDKELLRLIGRAVDITNGAFEGAKYALEDKTYAPPEGSSQ